MERVETTRLALKNTHLKTVSRANSSSGQSLNLYDRLLSPTASYGPEKYLPMRRRMQEVFTLAKRLTHHYKELKYRHDCRAHSVGLLNFFVSQS